MTIQTIHGPLDESQLEKRIVTSDEPDAFVTATEYWQLVHRSVHAELKAKNIFTTQAQGFDHG